MSHRSFILRATAFALAGCSTGGTVSDVGTPPSEPTHHAVVQGAVVDAEGRALGDVGVGPRFAQSSRPERQVSVTGGAYTNPDGTYHFTVEASTPKRADGLADFYVHATLYGPPGGFVRQDSVFVTAQFVPIGQMPNVVRVSQLRLPAP